MLYLMLAQCFLAKTTKNVTKQQTIRSRSPNYAAEGEILHGRLRKESNGMVYSHFIEDAIVDESTRSLSMRTFCNSKVKIGAMFEFKN